MAPTICAGASLPVWLAPLAKQAATFEYGPAPSAILLDETDITVSPDGTFTIRIRQARRILAGAGKSRATASQPYDASGQVVKSFQAWLLSPAGSVSHLGRKEAVDWAVYANARELYGDARCLSLVAGSAVDSGSIFAYEAVIEDHSTESQILQRFARDEPVERSTVIVHLPPRWTVRDRTFNHAAIEPVVTPAGTAWELRQLPGGEPEPMAPPLDSFAPCLALDFVAPTGVPGPKRTPFTAWRDISEYLSPYFERAAEPDPAVAKCGAELTTGAATNWDKIRRLCRYAQKATYIAINLNLAEQGGYQPRPASRVFQCNYGDCKDKATLLRALLRSQGIASYPVLLYSGDATHVHPEWPSPLQFNHCVVAIRIDEAIPEAAAATLIHPSLGRLLIFDPTNENLPPGLVPPEDCGGRGLVLAGAEADLINLPASLPGANRVVRSITAQLAEDGTVTGTLEESFFGAPSGAIRGRHARLSAAEFQKSIGAWLATTVPDVKLDRFDMHDDFDAAQLGLTLDFRGAAYGKPMLDRLLVFKPVLAARSMNVLTKTAARTQPVMITPASVEERIQISLPPGYSVDENFPTVDLVAACGHYHAKAELVAGRQLVLERSLALSAAVVPVSGFDRVRDFFEKMAAADQTPIVLRKNSPSEN